MLESIFAAWWYWFIAAFVLLILEIIVPGIFLVWLGMGAALVGLFLLAFPGADAAWQLLVLALSICGSVFVGLAWQRRIVHQDGTPLNQGLEGFIGRTALVSQPFQQGQGRIRLQDSSYPALCNASGLQAGQAVVITGVQGHALIVQPKN